MAPFGLPYNSYYSACFFSQNIVFQPIQPSFVKLNGPMCLPDEEPSGLLRIQIREVANFRSESFHILPCSLELLKQHGIANCCFWCHARSKRAQSSEENLPNISVHSRRRIPSRVRRAILSEVHLCSADEQRRRSREKSHMLRLL